MIKNKTCVFFFHFFFTRDGPRSSLTEPINSSYLFENTGAQVPFSPTTSFKWIYGLIVQLFPCESLLRDGYTDAVII